MTRRAAFALLLVWMSVGCSRFDGSRVEIARGTLGEEIVRVFCERMASDANPDDVMGLRWKPVCRGEQPPPADAPPRLVVLMENRARLAGALDRVLPEAIGDDLGHFMGELLPLYDPPAERLPQGTRLLAELLDTLAADREALDALARVGTREGYRPLRLALGVVRPVLSYPEFDDFAGLALRVITDLPEDPADGLAAEEWVALQRALALEMATLAPPDPVPAGERTTLELTRELLFRQDDAFGAGSPRWALIRDSRGLALPASGAIVAPFVDLDGDGLADVDSMGRFVDAGGAMLSVARPFRVRGEAGVPRDLGGRALRSDGTRLFEYVDVNRSMLAGVVREAGPLFDPASPTALQLARGLPAILGPDTPQRETYGAVTLEYVGPNTQRGSLFDVVYALSELMHRDGTDRALALTEILLRDHESETAGLLASAEHMIDRGDAYPDARLEQPNVLWDDLIDVGVEYAQDPGLIDAMLRSFADPRSAQLGTVYGGLMRHRDSIVYDPADPNGTPLGFPLDERVDRTQPDVVGNESLFQRSIALIDALDGVRVCNKAGAVLRIEVFGIPVRWPLFGSYDECELFDITNVAEAYALAILGRYELEINDGLLNGLVSLIDDTRIANVDDLLEQASGIDGLTRRPTAQALNRLVYWGLDTNPATGEPNCDFCGDLFERVIDRHGNDVIDTYPGTIFAWEQPGFYEGMIPLLEVLHRPEYQYSDSGRYRFGQLITALHRHWATPDHWLTQSTSEGAPNFSYQSGGRRYEENVADGFLEGRVVARMQALNAALDGIEVEPGRDGIRVLAELAEEMIDPARNPGLTTRDGRATIPRNDRSRELPVTPLLLVLDALRAMDRDLDAAPDRRESWRSARGSLASQLLGARPLGTGHVLENQRARAIILTVLPFLRERLAEHRARGDLAEWSRQLGPDLAELLRSPLVSGLIRFLDRVQDDPDAQGSLSRLIGYLVDEASTNDAFASTLYGGADLLMVLEDEENILPIAHALSQVLAPDARGAVAGTDPDGVLDVDGSVATDALGLTREVQRLDTRHTLRVVLANLVALDEGEDERTPLEEILDVMGELNRVTPGAGTSFVADDYASSLGETEAFLRDERRGLERLYDVVQEREIR